MMPFLAGFGRVNKDKQIDSLSGIEGRIGEGTFPVVDPDINGTPVS